MIRFLDKKVSYWLSNALTSLFLLDWRPRRNIDPLSINIIMRSHQYGQCTNYQSCPVLEIVSMLSLNVEEAKLTISITAGSGVMGKKDKTRKMTAKSLPAPPTLFTLQRRESRDSPCRGKRR